jgi:hypothetical protein
MQTMAQNNEIAHQIMAQVELKCEILALARFI